MTTPFQTDISIEIESSLKTRLCKNLLLIKGLTASFPTKLHFENINGKKIISSKLDYFFTIYIYL